MTLLAFLAIPSLVAFCFLAIAHTLQTMNLRLVENAPFPSEFSPDFIAAAAALGAAQAVAPRVYSYDRLVNYGVSRSRRFAAAKESNVPRFLRIPASFLPEYRRSRPDFGPRMMASLDWKQKPPAGRSVFPRRRTRLAALTRRPRSLSPAMAA